MSGKVQLPKLQPVPQPLKHLLEDQGPNAKQFHQNIRQYNSAFTFTSLGATFDQILLQGNGPYVLRLHGELYHNHGLRVLTIVTRLHLSQPQWIAARYIVMVKGKKDMGIACQFPCCNYTVGPYGSRPTTMCI